MTMPNPYTCDDFQTCADQADREMRGLNCDNCDFYQEETEDKEDE